MSNLEKWDHSGFDELRNEGKVDKKVNKKYGKIANMPNDNILNMNDKTLVSDYYEQPSKNPKSFTNNNHPENEWHNDNFTSDGFKKNYQKKKKPYFKKEDDYFIKNEGENDNSTNYDHNFNKQVKNKKFYNYRPNTKSNKETMSNETNGGDYKAKTNNYFKSGNVYQHNNINNLNSNNITESSNYRNNNHFGKGSKYNYNNKYEITTENLDELGILPKSRENLINNNMGLDPKKKPMNKYNNNLPNENILEGKNFNSNNMISHSNSNNMSHTFVNNTNIGNSNNINSNLKNIKPKKYNSNNLNFNSNVTNNIRNTNQPIGYNSPSIPNYNQMEYFNNAKGYNPSGLKSSFEGKNTGVHMGSTNKDDLLNCNQYIFNMNMMPSFNKINDNVISSYPNKNLFNNNITNILLKNSQLEDKQYFPKNHVPDPNRASYKLYEAKDSKTIDTKNNQLNGFGIESKGNSLIEQVNYEAIKASIISKDDIFNYSYPNNKKSLNKSNSYHSYSTISIQDSLLNKKTNEEFTVNIKFKDDDKQFKIRKFTEVDNLFKENTKDDIYDELRFPLVSALKNYTDIIKKVYNNKISLDNSLLNELSEINNLNLSCITVYNDNEDNTLDNIKDDVFKYDYNYWTHYSS